MLLSIRDSKRAYIPTRSSHYIELNMIDMIIDRKLDTSALSLFTQIPRLGHLSRRSPHERTITKTAVIHYEFLQVKL